MILWPSFQFNSPQFNELTFDHWLGSRVQVGVPACVSAAWPAVTLTTEFPTTIVVTRWPVCAVTVSYPLVSVSASFPTYATIIINLEC